MIARRVITLPMKVQRHEFPLETLRVRDVRCERGNHLGAVPVASASRTAGHHSSRHGRSSGLLHAREQTGHHRLIRLDREASERAADRRCHRSADASALADHLRVEMDRSQRERRREYPRGGVYIYTYHLGCLCDLPKGVTNVPALLSLHVYADDAVKVRLNGNLIAQKNTGWSFVPVRPRRRPTLLPPAGCPSPRRASSTPGAQTTC